MEKKKKIILIILAILLLIGITIGIICLIKNKDRKDDGGKPTPKVVDKITIEFDADGGSEVESITFNKGDAVELPATEKEGYTFEGWYNGSELVDNEATSKLTAKTVFLKAKWEEIKKEDKVMKITFDSKGGSKVSAITIKCENDAATIKSLPKNPTKDGYTFRAWEDKHGKVILVDAKLTCDDITLYAAYDKKETTTPTSNEKKYYTVTFDSKGGSSVSPIKVECDTDLKLPTAPTKSGYNFVSWVDSWGTPILDGALLTCEDVKLYANWSEKTKTYSCPDGYDIDANHKCTKSVNAKTKCVGEREYEYEGKCVTLTDAARKDTEKSCPKEMITIKSYAQYETGKVVQWGAYGCAYHKTDDTNSTCESHAGYKWVTPENACYVKWIANNTINTCDHLTNYAHITNPNSYSGVNALNGGCFPLKDKTYYCEDSNYKLEGTKCVKTIDATTKEE